MISNTKRYPGKAESFSISGLSGAFPDGARLTILSLILLLSIGWLGHSTVEREMKNNLFSQLQTTLDANIFALKLWNQTKRTDSIAWSSLPTIREIILSLVNKTSQGDWTPEALLRTPELKQLRQYLRPVCEKYSYIGFVIMDHTGLQIAALLDEPVGRRMLIDRSDFVKRSLNGETLVSLPFPGEVMLPDTKGNWRMNHPTMFVSTPVRNEAGEIVAVFSFRIRPETEFTRIMETSRSGRSGETYAFDASGTMISNSRFTEQLREMGLLPRRPGTHSILNIHLRDPSRKQISKNVKAIIPREQQPQTKMAASATQGESGFDVEGYNDYRGVPVIGAWTWLPKYGFGLATEMDVEEAFKPLHTLRAGFVLFFGLLTVLFVTSWRLRERQLYFEDRGTRAEKARRESDEHVRAVIANANDGIITIDVNGVIESFNPAAERIFQYRADEVVGKNVSLLMPEPYKYHHDSYLEKYMQTGKATIIGMGREVLGRRKDRTTFSLELSVSEVNLEERRLFIGITRDITGRKQAEEVLNRLHQQNQLILNSAAEGILGFDEKGNFVFINPSASQLLGYSSEELVGKPMHDLVLHTRANGSPYSLDKSPNYKCLKMGIAYHIDDEVFWRKDGTSIPVEYSCNPITVDGGKITGTVITFMDITDRKKAEEELQRYARKLEVTNQELTDFAHIASHDLQEPLRKVIAFGDRLRMAYADRLDERGEDYIERMQKATRRMRQLIDDLLMFSRINVKEVNYETVNLNQVVREVLFDLDFRIEETRSTVRVNALPILEVDASQMRQLFQNLISNALKFHREDAPPNITISSRNSEPGKWKILVEDNGIGFENKYLDRMFKPFQRLTTGTSFNGNGIGLAICQKIVTRHHGDITALGRPNQGSQFIITLPEKKPDSLLLENQS